MTLKMADEDNDKAIFDRSSRSKDKQYVICIYFCILRATLFMSNITSCNTTNTNIESNPIARLCSIVQDYRVKLFLYVALFISVLLLTRLLFLYLRDEEEEGIVNMEHMDELISHAQALSLSDPVNVS